MHTHEHVGLSCNVAADEGEMLRAVEHRLVDVSREVAVLRRYACLRDASDELLSAPSVPDEIGDRDE